MIVINESIKSEMSSAELRRLLCLNRAEKELVFIAYRRPAAGKIWSNIVSVRIEGSKSRFH